MFYINTFTFKKVVNVDQVTQQTQLLTNKDIDKGKHFIYQKSLET